LAPPRLWTFLSSLRVFQQPTTSGQARFMGRPQQTFCTIASLPHFAQRNPAMAQSLPPKMRVATTITASLMGSS
jgi:hypothetical protein